MTPTPKATSDGDRGAGLPPPRYVRTQSLPKSLLIGFATVMPAIAFAKLGSDVGDGETRSFNMQFLQLAQTLRAAQPWLAEVMRDLSGMASTVVLTLFAGGTVVYLVLFTSRA